MDIMQIVKPENNDGFQLPAPGFHKAAIVEMAVLRVEARPFPGSSWLHYEVGRGFVAANRQGSVCGNSAAQFLTTAGSMPIRSDARTMAMRLTTNKPSVS